MGKPLRILVGLVLVVASALCHSEFILGLVAGQKPAVGRFWPWKGSRGFFYFWIFIVAGHTARRSFSGRKNTHRIGRRPSCPDPEKGSPSASGKAAQSSGHKNNKAPQGGD